MKEPVPVSDFLATLTSPGPDAEKADGLNLFGQFVGSWDLVVTDYGEDGTTSSTSGEWHFGWVLAGRAIADVWICPRRTSSGRSPGKHGVSIRFPDPTIDGWRSTWLEPGLGAAYVFVARPTGDGGITLTGRFDDCHRRWTFLDIAPNSFRWRNETSQDGANWRLVQRFEAMRA